MQTHIQIHPGIPSRFRMLDAHPRDWRKRYGQSLAEWYEDGEVLVFPDHGLSLTEEDKRILAALRLDNSRSVKKADYRHILQPLSRETWDSHIIKRFGLDLKQAKQLQRIVRDGTRAMSEYIHEAFQGYKWLQPSISWRFQRTVDENPHYDSYGAAEDFRHNVRVFANVDNKPRRWRVTWPLADALRQHVEIWRPWAHYHPNRLNAKLNEHLPWDRFAYHEVEFAPGSLWLANSQMVSHQIVWGRRLLAATYTVAPETMLDPSKNFATRFQALIKELTHALPA